MENRNIKKKGRKLTRKVLVSNPDDDDAHRQAGSPHDGVDGQVHVGDDAVSQNEQNLQTHKGSPFLRNNCNSLT